MHVCDSLNKYKYSNSIYTHSHDKSDIVARCSSIAKGLLTREKSRRVRYIVRVRERKREGRGKGRGRQ